MLHIFDPLRDITFISVAVRLILALVCGGGIGNIIDRIYYGFVVDLFDFGWFPVFNVADICICVGCGLMFLYVILSIKEPA